MADNWLLDKKDGSTDSDSTEEVWVPPSSPALKHSTEPGVIFFEDPEIEEQDVLALTDDFSKSIHLSKTQRIKIFSGGHKPEKDTPTKLSSWYHCNEFSEPTSNETVNDSTSKPSEDQIEKGKVSGIQNSLVKGTGSLLKQSHTDVNQIQKTNQDESEVSSYKDLEVNRSGVIPNSSITQVALTNDSQMEDTAEKIHENKKLVLYDNVHKGKTNNVQYETSNDVNDLNLEKDCNESIKGTTDGQSHIRPVKIIREGSSFERPTGDGEQKVEMMQENNFEVSRHEYKYVEQESHTLTSSTSSAVEDSFQNSPLDNSSYMCIYPNQKEDDSVNINGKECNPLKHDSLDHLYEDRSASKLVPTTHTADVLVSHADFLSNEAVENVAQEIENEYKCNIRHRNGYMKIHQPFIRELFSYIDPVKSNKSKGRYSFVLQQGDIADSSADVIICPVDLQGNVSPSTLSTKGDRHFNEECAKFVSSRKQYLLRPNAAACFASKSIMFAILPVTVLTSFDKKINPIIEELVQYSEAHGYRSIAFPVDYSETLDVTHIVEALLEVVRQTRIPASMYIEFQLVLKNTQVLETVKEVLSQKELEHNMIHTQYIPEDEKSQSSKIDIDIHIGSIVEQELTKKVDMVVNSIDPQGSFETGVVNRAIIEKAGRDIKSEYAKQNPGGMRVGDVSVTSAGNLGCKKICHALLSQGWDTLRHIALKMLIAVIKQCLQAADDNFCGSIVFPALGAGTLRYPLKTVANVMFDTIEHYGKCRPDTCIHSVYIAIVPGDEYTKKVFADVLRHRGRRLFDGRDVVSRNDMKLHLQYLEYVEPVKCVVFRVIPRFSLGMCFDVGAIFTITDTPGEDMTELFHNDMNLYKIKVCQGYGEGSLKNALRKCLQHSNKRQFESVCFSIEEERSPLEIVNNWTHIIKEKIHHVDFPTTVYMVVPDSVIIDERVNEIQTERPKSIKRRSTIRRLMGHQQPEGRLFWNVKHRRLEDFVQSVSHFNIQTKDQETMHAIVDFTNRNCDVIECNIDSSI